MPLFLTIALATAPLASQAAGPIGNRPQYSPRPRPAIATLEGLPSAPPIGLFDSRTGAYAPGRLDDTIDDLDGLELLPIDHVGRTELTARLADTPRVRFDVGTVSRLELPGSRGTLYRYRVRAGAQRTYGFLHVGGDGVPRIALERPALAGGADPFLPRVAVDQLGRGILVATSFAAGGDLLELDLDARTSIDRTPGIGPLTIGEDGLWLGSTWGFGVAHDGIFRFARQPGATAALVPVAGTPPAAWRGDAAMSPTRNAAVAVGGSGVDSLVPYVFDAQSPARPAASIPSKISPAGYAPATTFGPFLAVSDDAATCAWRVELVDPITMRAFRDVVIGRASATFDPVAITGDPFVTDTLDEVGRVFFARIGELMFAVGEQNTPTEGGLESSDLFGATLDLAGTATLRNVTGTSGSTVPPFNNIPTWTPAFIGLLDEDVALIHEDDGKQLIALDLASGVHSVVLPLVREVLWVERAGPGGAWCAAVERDTPNREMQVVGAGAPMAVAQVLDAGSPATLYLVPTVSGGGTLPVVGYLRRDLGLDRVQASLPTSGQTLVWSPVGGSITPPLTFAGPRRLVFSRLAGVAGNEQRVWSILGGPDLVLQAIPRPSFLLP